mmetsp:Transcript_59149/g.157367  ORF Transcript_59149/g.157367 Transcript_59149/m.157367 type:complete len:205 (-) Transcript_59149:544-1158(-)
MAAAPHLLRRIPFGRPVIDANFAIVALVLSPGSLLLLLGLWLQGGHHRHGDQWRGLRQRRRLRGHVDRRCRGWGEVRRRRRSRLRRQRRRRRLHRRRDRGGRLRLLCGGGGRLSHIAAKLHVCAAPGLLLLGPRGHAAFVAVKLHHGWQLAAPARVQTAPSLFLHRPRLIPAVVVLQAIEWQRRGGAAANALLSATPLLLPVAP